MGIRLIAAVAVALGSLAAPSIAQQSPWTATANGHEWRGMVVEGSRGLALSIAWPWSITGDAGRDRGVAIAEASRRAAAADAALPAGARTETEIGHGFTRFGLVLESASSQALAPWLAALAAPLEGMPSDVRPDALARDLALAALAADDSDWLFPGDRLLGSAQRQVLAGSPFATGRGGDAEALQRVTAAELESALAAAPPAPLVVAAIGEVNLLAQFESLVALLPRPAATSGVRPRTPESPRIDLDAPPPFVEHPRVDAAFAAIALPTRPLEAGGIAEAVAVEVLRRRARQRFSDFRGGELFARAPFVAGDLLVGDPLVVLHRRGPTPDLLVPGAAAPEPATLVSLPHRELVELLRDCERNPVGAAEAASALGVVRAEWAVPPFSDALRAAMRRLPQAGAGPARTLCLLRRRGLDDEAVRAGLELDAMAVSAALRALVERVSWHGGLVPVPATLLGG